MEYWSDGVLGKTSPPITPTLQYSMHFEPVYREVSHGN